MLDKVLTTMINGQRTTDARWLGNLLCFFSVCTNCVCVVSEWSGLNNSDHYFFFHQVFSSPCLWKCELLPSLCVRRPLTFHILMFSSTTACPNEQKLSSYRDHLWKVWVRVAQSLVFCVMVGRLIVGFVWLNL
jgi:hypothetical protein